MSRDKYPATYDDMNYTVTGNRGFRHANLTRVEATLLVARLKDIERTDGVQWNPRLWYRDGTEVSPQVSTFRLIVKGSKQEATQAAEARGLTLSDVKELHYNQVVATCEAEHMQLAGWFAEPARCVVGTGFPVGTLLFYKQTDKQ